MKKFIALLFLGAVSCFAAEVNLIPDPAGAARFKNWYNPASSRITAANGIITVAANADNVKVNRYQKAQVMIPLKGSALQGKKFELSFKYRTSKLQGSLQVAVREAFGKRYSTYHGMRLKRWDVSPEWKSCKHTFTSRKNADSLSLYIVGSFMKKGEKVELKDLKLVVK